LPEAIADDLNYHNDAYPLARPSEAAALATLMHEDKIQTRARELHALTEKLAADLSSLGVRTFPTATYFFLADFSPHKAGWIAEQLKQRGFLLKPLNDPRLGDGFMRVTTSLPENNVKFVAALKDIMS